MAIRSRPLTYADLQRIRETRDERLELIEGEIVVTPSPSALHQLVVLRLAALLKSVIVDAGRGLALPAPFDTVLDNQNVLQPDLFVLLHDRSQLMGKSQVRGAPSLAIEIISPSTAARDRRAKRDLYAQYGVPEYWLIDPDRRTVTIYSDLQEGRYQRELTTTDVAVSSTIPEVSADLAELFDPVPGF